MGGSGRYSLRLQSDTTARYSFELPHRPVRVFAVTVVSVLVGRCVLLADTNVFEWDLKSPIKFKQMDEVTPKLTQTVACQCATGSLSELFRFKFRVAADNLRLGVQPRTSSSST